MIDHPLEKAGVFAVRMGRPLAENLRRSVLDEPLVRYRPQRRWLALIGTGDRVAVASRGPLHAHGALVWRWKDWIDRRFMRRFTVVGPRPAGSRGPAVAVPPDADDLAEGASDPAMHRGGCGAKIGATVLERALARVRLPERDDLLVGLQSPDDAAVVRVPPGKASVQTVDFFRAFVDDPWLFGRITANHALGDVFAMGATAETAMAIATIPPGPERQVEETVYQLLAGAVSVLEDAGCRLVGGHTVEGRELALGFAVFGLVDVALAGVLRKGGMRPGDALILTKPIGTGILLAGHARLLATGRWVDAALESMQVSNRAAAACLVEHGATACTDVTGFGLVGHLAEMTRASAVDAELELGAVPLLPGALALAAAGVRSSLHPANARLTPALQPPGALVDHPCFPLLFDPQTAGGLLASVPAGSAQRCLAALHRLGCTQAAIVGRAVAPGDATEPIRLIG